MLLQVASRAENDANDVSRGDINIVTTNTQNTGDPEDTELRRLRRRNYTYMILSAVTFVSCANVCCGAMGLVSYIKYASHGRSWA